VCILCYFISGDLYSGAKNVLVQGVDISSFHVDLNVNICEMNGATNRYISNRRVFMFDTINDHYFCIYLCL
jgi:hypothetical protein